jgi:hypothetical protein
MEQRPACWRTVITPFALLYEVCPEYFRGYHKVLRHTKHAILVAEDRVLLVGDAVDRFDRGMR